MIEYNENINIDSVFDSDNTELILDVLENVDSLKLSAKHHEVIINMLQNSSKGVSNFLADFLINNKTPAVAEQLTQHISSKDIVFRNTVGFILSKSEKMAVGALLNYISRTKNDNDIKFALDILSKIVDPRIEKPLIELVQQSKNNNIIISCIEVLGKNKSVNSINALTSLYNQDEVYKPFIIDAFGKIGSSRSLDFLIRQYNKEDDFLKLGIIESLGEIGDEDTFFFLLSILYELSGPITITLLESVYKLSKKFSFDIPYEDRIKEAILYTFLHGKPNNLRHAVNLLSVFDDPEIISASLELYGKYPEFDEVLYPKYLNNVSLVLTIISKLTTPASENLHAHLMLIQSLIETFPNIKQEISIVALQRIIETITGCLKHTDELIRLTAMELLFKISSETAFMFLDNSIFQESIWIRLRVSELLADFKHPLSFDVLNKLINDEDLMVREKAKLSLEHLENIG